jgi:hypothetical protein
MIHLLQFSSFYLHPFFLVPSVSLRFLYSFLYSGYINPSQVLSCPTLLLYDLPLVWPVFHNIATFVLGLCSTNEREHVAFLPLLPRCGLGVFHSTWPWLPSLAKGSWSAGWEDGDLLYNSILFTLCPPEINGIVPWFLALFWSHSF